MNESELKEMENEAAVRITRQNEKGAPVESQDQMPYFVMFLAAEVRRQRQKRIDLNVDTMQDGPVSRQERKAFETLTSEEMKEWYINEATRLVDEEDKK